MISVQEAESIIFQHFFLSDTVRRTPFGEGVPLMASLGRILAEDIVADRDFPPFDRVTMDGIAIRFADFESGSRKFKTVGVQAAGYPQLPFGGGYTCMEVMTGAILPHGYDTVIRYEDLKMEEGEAIIDIETVSFQQNLHKNGIDRKQNDVIVKKGKKITAAEIATAATVGLSVIQVVRLPKTAVISTGDELVNVHETPLLHQIRRSNAYALAALLESEFRMQSQLFHFNDDENSITDGLKKILNEYEVVILSGAVSEGKYDFVPQVLNSLGVKKLFHKVAQRPGKPFWFGTHPTGRVIFALPGNPVSTFLCACRYVIPFFRKNLGITENGFEKAVLTEKITFKPDLTYFLPVKLQYSEMAVLEALPLAGQGSGDLANLNDADGFLELPQGREVFEKGEVFTLIRYRK